MNYYWNVYLLELRSWLNWTTLFGVWFNFCQKNENSEFGLILRKTLRLLLWIFSENKWNTKRAGCTLRCKNSERFNRFYILKNDLENQNSNGLEIFLLPFSWTWPCLFTPKLCYSKIHTKPNLTANINTTEFWIDVDSE